MNDEFSLYENGISHLLHALKGNSSQQLYRHALLMQMELAQNIAQARKYRPSRDQEADLNRILEQLIELSLLTTGKSFYEWCQTQPARKQKLRDLFAFAQANPAQDLLEAFIKLGARASKDQSLTGEDLLERYANVPLHAFFLYTSEDEAISSYILNNWDALDALSGTICDIHPLLEQFQSTKSAYEYIQTVDILKEASFCNLSQLPGLFFWDHAGGTAYISFGVEAKPTHIKNVLRVVFEELYREPSLASINRAGHLLKQAENFVPSPQRFAESKPTRQKRHFSQLTRRTDIGIIIALQEEFDVFFPTIAKMQHAESDPESGISFFRFDVPSGGNETSPYHCVSSLLGRTGPTTAAMVTQRMIDLYQPDTFVILGIAAGIHPDIRLGDVIVADSIDSYTDRGKLDERNYNNNAFSLSFSGQVYQCSSDLLHRLHTFKYQYRSAYERWRRSSNRFWKKNLTEALQSSLISTGNLHLPVTYTIGPLASGPLVIASSSFKELLLQRNRSLLGIEMEASGVLAALNQTISQRRSLVLRGVSDFGDERKTELDQVQQGILRQFAMYNTVQLFWKLLEVRLFPQNFSPSIL